MSQYFLQYIFEVSCFLQHDFEVNRFLQHGSEVSRSCTCYLLHKPLVFSFVQNLLRESLVFPQSEDITIPYMLTDQDEVYQGEPPPAWKRKPPSASDLVPPVAPTSAGSPKPGFPAPSSPGGLGGTGLIQTPSKSGTPGGVVQTPGSPGVSAQTPRPDYELVPSPASSSVAPLGSKLGLAANSPEPGKSYPPPEEGPVGSPGVVGHLPFQSAVSPETRNSDRQSRAHQTSEGEAAFVPPTSNVVHSSTTSGFETLAPGVEEKAGPSEARTPGIEGSLLPGVSKGESVAGGARDLKSGAGSLQDVLEGSIDSRSESEVRAEASQRQGLGNVHGVVGLESHVDEHHQGGFVGLDGQNAGGVNKGERAGVPGAGPSSQSQGPEAHLAAIGEGNESTAAESQEDNKSPRSTGRVPRGDGRGVREQRGLHPSSSRGPTTGGQDGGLAAAAQDPFPPVDDHAHAGGVVLAQSPSKGPLDPWDLVAQGRTQFPNPAAPDAFRNGSLEQPEAPSPAGGPSVPAQGVALEPKQGPAGPASPASGRSEGLLEEQEGSSGSDRSLGSADSSADVAGGAADVAGNRKAMMLDYGKKIGLSFRERGRKYLEKGRLGTLLHKGEGEGLPPQ
jgi:hypothetical protein